VTRKRIAIVGGGPAGSSLALQLLRRGVEPGDLVIFDRARFPRPKLCGGALTYRGTELLRDLVGRPEEGATTDGLVFRSSLGRFEVRERGPQWLYDRAWLDDRLLDAVRAAGVEIRESCSITAVEPGHDAVAVRWATGAEPFEWVVGADGARSTVRRSAELPGGPLGLLVEGVYEAEAGADVDPSLLYFDFDPILRGIPGYAWIFPFPRPGSRGLYKVGVMDGRGATDGARLRAYTEELAARHGLRPAEEKIGGWPEHYYAARNRAHRPGLILVGEALGVDPLLGEGIAPSFESAGYAAGRLKKALDRGRRTIPFYEAGFAYSAPGWNLRFMGALADRLYGDHPFRWMRVLFEHRYMHALAGSGQHAYGELTGQSPGLILRYAWQALREGFPSKEPPTIATPPTR